MIMTRDIVESIKADLACSQKKIALMINVDPHTITNNLDRPIEELTPRTREKLTNLYSVMLKVGPLRSDIMMAVLEKHTYADHRGRMDSVVSAIQQEKYDVELLIKIAQKANKEVTDAWTSSHPQLTTENQSNVSA